MRIVGGGGVEEGHHRVPNKKRLPPEQDGVLFKVKVRRISLDAKNMIKLINAPF